MRLAVGEPLGVVFTADDRFYRDKTSAFSCGFEEQTIPIFQADIDVS